MKTDLIYWNGRGLYNDEADALQKVIPASGEVENKTKNRKLEKYRKAQNCYYDLYNNGLGNRKAEFRKVFGFASSNFATYGSQPDFEDVMYERTEKIMDELIINAYNEQIKKGNI